MRAASRLDGGGNGRRLRFFDDFAGYPSPQWVRGGRIAAVMNLPSRIHLETLK